MALWTPTNFVVRPEVEWWPDQGATFSGTNLSAFANSGTEGGAATIGGTPTKVTVNAKSGVRFATAGQHLYLSRGAYGASGKMTVLAVFRPVTTTCALFSNGAIDPNINANLIATFLDPAVQSEFIVNGFNGSPYVYADVDFGTVGSCYVGSWQVNTNAVQKFGTAQTISTNRAGSVPNYGARTWAYFEDATGGVGQVEVLYYAEFKNGISADELAIWTGWAAWYVNEQANLDPSSPFLTAPPQYVPTVAVPKGSLTYTGYAPALVGNSAVAVPKGALAYTGRAPTLVIPSAVSPPKGSLAYSGYAPTLTNTTQVAVPKGAQVYTGYAPTILTISAIAVPKGALTYTGHAPTVTNSGSSVIVPKGALRYTGFAPTLLPVQREAKLIPVTNSLDVARRNANAILAELQSLLPGYGTVLPDPAATLDGRLFSKTDEAMLYQLQNGAWVAQDGTP